MEYPNHKHLAKSQKKLAKLQQQLSRKSKGSNRREKARIKVARSISDSSWGELRRQLEYKAGWYGKQLVTVDRSFPSSQLYAPLAALNGPAQRICESGFAPSAALSMTGM